MSNALLPLGQIVATPGALAALEEAGQQPTTFLERHESGDWGDCGAEDKQENDLSVRESFSVYHTSKGQKIWIITEADRSSTCILLPDEY